ncbi:MAG TPA: hypothetical protein VH143_03735 [Kofleriaceae bacterium]|nr:hypothetical protein [Kofleriaceae bacterium]
MDELEVPRGELDVAHAAGGGLEIAMRSPSERSARSGSAGVAISARSSAPTRAARSVAAGESGDLVDIARTRALRVPRRRR